MSKILGVIGGLGPLATAYYYELVTRMTKADRDQEHLELLLHSAPAIPDRTGYILGESSENPLPELLRIGGELERQGAEVLAMPCITAHYFHHDLVAHIHVPIIHLIEEVVSYLKERAFSRIGIMATDGTVRSALFQQELARNGMEAVIPSPEYQADVTHLIYRNIKTGTEPEMERFHRTAAFLREQGAEVIILGCTELSLIKRDQAIGAGFLDALDVLAVCSVQRCGAVVKQEYRELITEG